MSDFGFSRFLGEGTICPTGFGYRLRTESWASRRRATAACAHSHPSPDRPSRTSSSPCFEELGLTGVPRS